MNRALRRTAVAAAAVAIGAGAGLVAGRRAVRNAARRARSVRDPARGEALRARPGDPIRVESFDGTPLEVRVVGEGAPGRPALVFAHGFSLDLTTWHFQWMDLARTHRCILFDQRGHGRSGGAGPGGYSVESLARDLRAVLDATVRDGSAVLIGHSMGGMGVLALAEHFPEEMGGRVRGAVLADMGAADLLKEALGDVAVRATASMRRALLALGGRPRTGERARRFALGPGRDLAFLAARLTNFAPGAPPSVVEHVAQVSANTPAEVWPECLISMLDLDIRDAEAKLSVPTLVLVGALDRLTPPAAARRMTSELLDARFVEIAGAAHVSMMEQPAAFNEAVESFLASLPSLPGLPSTETAPVRAAP